MSDCATMGFRGATIALLITVGCVVSGLAHGAPALYTPGRTFNVSDHIVSTSVFHWYTSAGGQLSGPWRPLDGRSNWTGEPVWWQSQVKQMMAANIDTLWVHLIESMETQRVNLFKALNQLRAQGYDVPKVAPFLDPMITWDGQPLVNVATAAGKDEFVRHYIRFFQQYYSANQDQHADTYIQQINGKVVLDTWHVKHNLSNLSSLTRNDVESRLAAAFGQAHPVFNNGIRMVTTAVNAPTLSFADEKVVQFELHSYNYSYLYNGVRSVQLKGGYWDQNIRNPGYILPRDGGSHYRSAWNSINRSTVSRVYIESWNEYDEGSGIYAANPGAPYILPGSGNTSTDVWSSTNDPYEYIRTTAAGAAAFNDTPELDARVLWHSIPARMRPGTSVAAEVVVRNEGDLSWKGSLGFRFGQDRDLDPVVFAASDHSINDGTNEIPTYGGIFRGRPITFTTQVTSPAEVGTYLTHWGMARDGVGRFGEQIVVPVAVVVGDVPTPAAPTDAGVAQRSTSVKFNWVAVVDDISGIAGYNCQVGTAPGGSDVFNGYMGNVLTKTISGANGKTYYCQVQAVARDGCTSEWSASSDGITVDLTAPGAPGTPVDAGLYTDGTSLTFTWTAAHDADSGVTDYFCQIGTSPGSIDAFYGYVGNVLSKSVTVAPRRTYYCRVLAKDAAGNLGSWSASSDGIGVVDIASDSIAAAKTAPDGMWVGLPAASVSAVFSSHFYIQDEGGISGIRVTGSEQVQTGGRVRLYGSLGTIGGERVLNAEKVLGM